MEDYIEIYAISGDNYHPLDTDKGLPKEHRQFTICAKCGRQAHDCWAMGSMVDFNLPFDQPSYVACAYCSTYMALVAFMDTDVKWYDALQPQVNMCFDYISDACRYTSESSDLLATPKSCHVHAVFCQLLVVSERQHAHQVFVDWSPVRLYSLCKVLGYRDWMLSARGALTGLNITMAWVQEAIVISGTYGHASIKCMTSCKNRISFKLPT